jgi:hypothetical protein
VQSLRTRLCLLGIRRDHVLLLLDECRCAVVIGFTSAEVQRSRNTGMDSFIYLLFDCSTSAARNTTHAPPPSGVNTSVLVLTCRRRGTSRCIRGRRGCAHRAQPHIRLRPAISFQFFLSQMILEIRDHRNKVVVKTKRPEHPQVVIYSNGSLGSDSPQSIHKW